MSSNLSFYLKRVKSWEINMNILLFLLILIVLILVHEYGHFITAKWIGAKVEEFGIGYPPRALKLGTLKGTLFSLNWIPFGGFVKISGEQRDSDVELDKDAFYSKPRGKQAIVMVAGVLANFLLAWLLISTSYFLGAPVAADVKDTTILNQKLVITSIFEDTPADTSSLKVGDEILEVAFGEQVFNPKMPEDFQEIIALSGGEELAIKIKRSGSEQMINVVPEYDITENKSRIGVSIERIGVKKIGFFAALWEGMKSAGVITWATVVAFANLIYGAIVGTADFSQITGPVGIVKAVGDAYGFGLSYLLSFTALISINLVIINLLPIPALDGGRLLFLAIEAIRRKNIKVKTAQMANTIGFFALILLMIVVTFKDIKHLIF